MRIIQITEEKHKSMKEKLSKMKDAIEDCIDCLDEGKYTDYDEERRSRDYDRDDDDRYYEDERRRTDRRRSRY